jgi:hypothetical protein
MIFADGIPLRRGRAVVGATRVRGGDCNQDQMVATIGATVVSTRATSSDGLYIGTAMTYRPADFSRSAPALARASLGRTPKRR